METRPKITLTPSPLDNTLELLGKLFLVILWGLTLYAYLKLPEKIPTHFSAKGEADQYGGKPVLLVLPLLATAIYSGMTKLNNYPHIFNYPTKITESNARKQYTLATRLFRFMKLFILLLFSTIITLIYLTTTGVTNGLGAWFLPVLTGFIFIPITVTLIQSLK